MHVYRNATTGQTVESEDRIPRLDGLARWAHTEQADKPAPATVVEQDETTPTPRKSTRNRKARP